VAEDIGVPDAVRHSSCRSIEPGPYQTPAFVTALALQPTASKSYALRCVGGTSQIAGFALAADPLQYGEKSGR